MRTFLVVLDDTRECLNAMRYAAMRAARTGGGVQILSVIRSEEINQWLGVREIMREEARGAAVEAVVGWDDLGREVDEARKLIRPDAVDPVTIAATNYPVLRQVGPLFIASFTLSPVGTFSWVSPNPIQRMRDEETPRPIR